MKTCAFLLALANGAELFNERRGNGPRFWIGTSKVTNLSLAGSPGVAPAAHPAFG